jgi:hypothetical protein
MRKSIKIIELLKKARELCDYGLDGLGYDFDSNTERMKELAQAEILIELIEIEACGSVGGFDEGQSRYIHWTLSKRIEWFESKLGLI